MSARPVLTLVTSPPRPGQRALEFIRWAVDTFGEPATEPGVVVVRRTQTDLVAGYDGISSGGTVSRYMRQLRAAGVVIGGRPITVDLSALDVSGEPAVSGSPADGTPHPGSAPDDVGQPERAAAVAELLAHRREQQVRLLKLQAELLLTDLAIDRALSGSNSFEQDGSARELANRALAEPLAIREFREPGLANQEGRKGSLDNPPSFLTSDVANRERGTRECSRTADPLCGQEPALTYAEVDEILEPLRAWCRANSRIDHLDDNGRASLARLGRTRLTAGVARIYIEAEHDTTIHKPVGLLVDRARKGHADTFQPPADHGPAPWATSPKPTRPMTPVPDRSPDTAPIQALFEPCTSQRLDEEAIALAASPVGLATARSSLRTAHQPSTTIDKETHS